VVPHCGSMKESRWCYDSEQQSSDITDAMKGEDVWEVVHQS